ncbi:hypothetical protein BH18THE2_BH18THE2_01860 [soil metagenome]
MKSADNYGIYHTHAANTARYFLNKDFCDLTNKYFVDYVVEFNVIQLYPPWVSQFDYL